MYTELDIVRVQNIPTPIAHWQLDRDSLQMGLQRDHGNQPG